MGAIQVTQTATNNMSIIGLISDADIMVQIVMILLIIASMWSWAIIFDKLLKLRNIKNNIEEFEKLFWSGNSIDQLFSRIKTKVNNPLTAVFVAAMEEVNKYSTVNKLNNLVLAFGIKERLNHTMRVALNKEIATMEDGIGFLASLGSYAPFVGLFGTVWGIMHSFQSIAMSNNTNLSVVAPGIAEALLATAIGLIAAIPAVMFYNYIASSINKIGEQAENYSIELFGLLSREIERKYNHDPLINQTNNFRKRRHIISEINVTPLVDVMLVLLIIFMVTSPMLVAGIKVDLPETTAAPVSGQDEPLVVTIDAKGNTYLQDIGISRKELVPKLKAITKEKRDTRIFVRGDKNIDYGRIIEVIGQINEAGYSKVALITDIKTDVNGK